MSTNSSVSERHFRQRVDARELGDKCVPHNGAGYSRWKVAIDLGIALLLLIPAGAAIAILVLLVRATSKGPALYKQIRVGKGGRRFMMYKIRSMTADAEVSSGPVWTQPHDPRVTFLGGILRKLHLDELPQIFNVLRGEMSFVGPRPERPEFVNVLSESIPQYRDRIAVRPGITGLAQINLPPDTDLASVRRKLVLDLHYIERCNLWLDVRLLLCTALRIVKVHEGFLTWILGLRRPELLAAQQALPKPGKVTPETIVMQAAQAASGDAPLGAATKIESGHAAPKKAR